MVMSCLLALTGFLGSVAHAHTHCQHHIGVTTSPSQVSVSAHGHGLAEVSDAAAAADNTIAAAQPAHDGASHTNADGSPACCAGLMCHCCTAIMAASSIRSYEPRQTSKLTGPASDAAPVSLPIMLERPPKSSLAA